jgi:phosphoglycerate dehydrogenase-like enzyme
MKLVTTRPFTPEIEAEFRALVPDLRIAVAKDLDSLLVEVADADIVTGSYGGGSGDTFKRIIDAAKQVRWVHTSSAGVDELLGPHVFERDFVFTSGKGDSVANLLAEHAFALMLSLTRGVIKAARLDGWHPELFRGNIGEVKGLTMGIIGFGAVGQALAKRALAFEMRVIGIKATPTPPPPGMEAIWGPEKRQELLAQSDVVVLILPNTPETRGSFGEDQLRSMKKTSLLINIGRGHVADGAAIERALVEGWIAGAGLDVMPEEPWPSSSPLWKMDNVILTPHTAGNSPNRAGRDMEVFRQNFRRFVQGEPLVSVVDRKATY